MLTEKIMAEVTYDGEKTYVSVTNKVPWDAKEEECFECLNMKEAQKAKRIINNILEYYRRLENILSEYEDRMSLQQG